MTEVSFRQLTALTGRLIRKVIPFKEVNGEEGRFAGETSGHSAREGEAKSDGGTGGQTPMVPKRPRLGEMLLERGVVTPEQLDDAVARQQANGERLGKILQGMGLVSTEEILETVGRQLGVPYCSLADPSVTLERVTDAFPLKFMQHYKFLAVKRDDGALTVVMSDPADVDTLDSIRLQTGEDVEVVLGDEKEILQALDQHYGPSSSMERIIRDIQDEGDADADGEGDVAHLKDLASEAPVIRLVNLVITKAVERRASDIHIEPFEGRLRVRYRIDGVLLDVESPPRRLEAAIVSRVKLMAKMNIAERRLPQDGRIRMAVNGRDLDLRVSTIPTIHGESVVMRLLDRASVLLSLDELGFPPAMHQPFESLIRKPHGMILVTGPTGSGKTTTLYAALRAINSVEKKIITIEDPVEYQLDGLNQIQVKPKIGLTFASGLRHIVRQDPDVILVGEIRDRETAEIAIHAALTGHLVLSTLHTNDAPGAITRLLDMGVEDYLVSSTLLAVLAQRLVRKICPECRDADVPETEASEQSPRLPVPTERARPLEGHGCPACNYTGYFGRVGIFELLLMAQELQRLVVQQADANVIRETAVGLGMKTLWQDGWEKAVAGMTTREEVLRVTQQHLPSEQPNPQMASSAEVPDIVPDRASRRRTRSRRNHSGTVEQVRDKKTVKGTPNHGKTLRRAKDRPAPNKGQRETTAGEKEMKPGRARCIEQQRAAGR